MARICSIANTKGGVGKSTLATNFAVTLANAGKRVFLVDADPQASSMSFLSVRDDARTNVQCRRLGCRTIRQEGTQCAGEALGLTANAMGMAVS